MATSTQIQFVQDNLPSHAASLGWNTTKIGEVVDSEGTATRAVRAFWAARVAQTSDFVNISESGSSRSLEDIWKHAVEMLKYWDGRVAAEDDEQGVVNPRGRIAFHTANRV